MLRRAPSRAGIIAIAMATQAIVGLALGLPGHLSQDSIVQLYEARTLQFISFQPPSMSLLLRIFDSWLPGTALFVVADQLLLTASFALLFLGRDSRLGRLSLFVALARRRQSRLARLHGHCLERRADVAPRGVRLRVPVRRRGTTRGRRARRAGVRRSRHPCARRFATPTRADFRHSRRRVCGLPAHAAVVVAPGFIGGPVGRCHREQRCHHWLRGLRRGR